MNKLKYLILLTFLLTGCGPKLELGDFKSYVTSFEAESLIRGQSIHITNLKIQFGFLPSNLLGLCNVNNLATPLITINPDLWTNMDDTQKEQVVYHELGHCVLHRVHNNSLGPIDKTRLYDSLMDAQPLLLIDYASNRDSYLNELFDKNNYNTLY